MRLLQIQGDSEFSLVGFVGNSVPDYAILSHTWGSDTEEATYQDMTSRTGKHKTGFRKIRFCGEQAKNDGIDFFWVDTCCTIQSHNRYLCPTKVAVHAAEDGGRMYRGP